MRLHGRADMTLSAALGRDGLEAAATCGADVGGPLCHAWSTDRRQVMTAPSPLAAVGVESTVKESAIDAAVR